MILSVWARSPCQRPYLFCQLVRLRSFRCQQCFYRRIQVVLKIFSITKLNQATTGFLTQWNTINFFVDGLVTGYFNSQEQLHQIAEFAKQRKLARFVDPIMADNGRLYTGYQQDFVTAMQQFCQNADVITPNITEACLLADVPYLGEDYTRKDIEELLLRLKKFHNKQRDFNGCFFQSRANRISTFQSTERQRHLSYV